MKHLLLIILLTSCYAQEKLTEPRIHDGLIVKVEKKTIWTENHMGFLVPHHRPKKDTIDYKVGTYLIHE